MADLKRVAAGEVVTFSASTWNAFLDAAIAERRRQVLSTETADVFRQATIVRVKNESGADQLRHRVLGISGPLFTPSADLGAFEDEVILRAVAPVTPGHLGKFVITTQPIKAGAIGRAVVSGIVQAKVSISDATHSCADVSTTTANLISVKNGSAMILWKASSTGTAWCLVRLGNRCVP